MVQAGLFFPNLINILIWIPLLLLVLPGAWILWLYKKSFEKLVTKFLKPNYRPPNDLMDMTMCQGGSYSLPNTNCAQIWLVSGKWISAQEFSSHFHRCFLEGNSEKYKNLYAHVKTYGTYSFYAHCSTVQLDLNWHIREYSLSDYGNGTLESFSVVWMTTNTYERDRPVWQVAILHLGDPQTGNMETGIVAKFSHSLVDGYSFVHMVGKLTDNPAPYIVKDRTFTWKDKLKFIYQSPIDLLSLYGDMAFSRDSQSPFKKAIRPSTSSDKISQQWLMSLATLKLDHIKMIRKATDSHFICLMIAAQFGALRKLMLETQEEAQLPEYLWIGSSLPWPRHPLALTNHWTMGYFKCPFRLQDPMQRLRWVEAYYRHFKQVEYDTKGTIALAPLLRLLPTWARRFFCHYDFALYNVSLFFASLMLSPKKHYLLGREVKRLYLPLACSDVIPVALYGVTTSHSGQIDLSISACKAIVRNQEELDRLTQIYFIEELDSIAALCGLTTASASGQHADSRGAGDMYLDQLAIASEKIQSKLNIL